MVKMLETQQQAMATGIFHRRQAQNTMLMSTCGVKGGSMEKNMPAARPFMKACRSGTQSRRSNTFSASHWCADEVRRRRGCRSMR